MRYDYLVIGGDQRQYALVDDLMNHRFSVMTMGLDPLKKDNVKRQLLPDLVPSAKRIIGPMVWSRDGKTMAMIEDGEPLALEDFLKYMKAGQILFGGCIPESFVQACQEKKIKVYDLMSMEDVVIWLSIATAEGAIAKAMAVHPTCLHQSGCLVMGYGHCGKMLGKKLHGFGAKVDVCSRDQIEGMQAMADGLTAISIHDLSRKIMSYSYVFNTIPAVCLKGSILRRVRKDTCIVDVASPPGGIEVKEAKELGITWYPCPNLPGKYAPRSTGRYLAKKIMAMEGGDAIDLE